MYRVKQYITNLENRKITETIYVKDKIVYVENYKYQNEAWFIKTGDNWIDLQGGVPSIEFETLLDKDIFEEVGDGNIE